MNPIYEHPPRLELIHKSNTYFTKTIERNIHNWKLANTSFWQCVHMIYFLIFIKIVEDLAQWYKRIPGIASSIPGTIYIYIYEEDI